jgi:DNA polymerase III delta prime subunit
MNHYKDLWCEKYRPQKISDIVLSEDSKEHLKNISDDIPHLLFYGKAGTGKTTTAKVLINDVLKCQYLYINASDESGIDTIRNKVISFAQTRSVDGQKKVILLDESDGLSASAMRTLRNVMEEYANSTRFILTANDFNKIIEPIRSRCVIFNLKPDLKGCVQRCVDILKRENVDYNDSISKLVVFVKDRYPDMRRMVNDLQKFSISGKLQLENVDLTETFSHILFKKLIQKENSLDLRKMIIEGESEFDSDYQNLYKSLFDVIYNSNITEIKKKTLMLELGEYTYRDNFVVDHEINFFCFILSAENIIKA